jgi:hypothetical protein
LEQNKQFHTPRQFKRAKRARGLCHSLGTPSLNEMQAILRMNTVKDNPVISEDVKLAEKIFRLDIGTIKGKTTRILDQKNFTLAIHGMMVNRIKFLITISKNLYYPTAHYMPNQTIELHA